MNPITPMAKVGIVTVLYNSALVLKEYFDSLNMQTFKDFVLYIIDNNSPDDSLETARKLASSVNFKCIFFAEDENWGVAKGNNIGINAALQDKCEYILLSNNDVVLNNTNTLELLVNKMSNSTIDILCPKIYYYHNPNIIWAAGGDFIQFDTATCHFGVKEKDSGQCDKEIPIRYTPTCFALIRDSVFKKIGLMDEEYFVYYDDTDFMYRAWKAGFETVYTPITSILHNESSSTGSGSPFQIYYIERNRLLFTKKNRPIGIFLGLSIQRILSLITKSIWTYPRVLRKAKYNGLKDGLKQSFKKSNH